MHRLIAVALVLTVVAACGSDPAPRADAVPANAPLVANEAASSAADALTVDETVEPALGEDPDEPIVYGDRYPEVLAVEATPSGDAASWRFSVTLSSSYDTPQRYADGWRVLDADDNELGLRLLLHDHASEQPFTRSHTVEVPEGVETVFVEGRDQVHGWSGQRFEVNLSR